jgi:hypothetical protein
MPYFLQLGRRESPNRGWKPVGTRVFFEDRHDAFRVGSVWAAADPLNTFALV